MNTATKNEGLFVLLYRPAPATKADVGATACGRSAAVRLELLGADHTRSETMAALPADVLREARRISRGNSALAGLSIGRPAIGDRG